MLYWLLWVSMSTLSLSALKKIAIKISYLSSLNCSGSQSLFWISAPCTNLLLAVLVFPIVSTLPACFSGSFQEKKLRLCCWLGALRNCQAISRNFSGTTWVICYPWKGNYSHFLCFRALALCCWAFAWRPWPKCSLWPTIPRFIPTFSYGFSTLLWVFCFT